jgi:zinc protease
LLYGNNHILGYPATGNEKDVEAIVIDDLKAFYAKNFSPTVTSYHVAGNITQEKVMNTLKSLNTNWAAKEVILPEYTIPERSEEANLYFVDIPQAKQSVINIGYMALPRTDKDFYPATVMNYKLGGSFSGNVNLILREEKGYTYGARTYFSGDTKTGTFTASSSVRTNTTYESTKIFMEEMEKYREGISQEDLDFIKNTMIKSNTRKFETLWSLSRHAAIEKCLWLPS